MNSKKLNVVIMVSGGGTNLQAILDEAAAGNLPGVSISAVISNNRGAFALERAKGAGIPAYVLRPGDYPERALFDEALTELIVSLEADLVVLAGCLLTIPPLLIRNYRGRIINIHPALIPAFSGKGFYGLRVHEAALERGVKITGATVHFVDEELDAGPIILQRCVAVQEGDTPEILQRRVMEEAEWKILPEAIRLIAEGRVTVDERNHVHISGLV